ncbi:MAG: glycine cleavage system protein GcvH [Methylococcaceae bacterium]|nr:glycine cleavage system protein GcvH [Methylococcaceae bacterium]
MSDFPDDLKYASSHEWAKLEEDNIVRVGISDFAQSELGDLVYVDFPEVGRKVSAGEQCAVVESVKTASDLFAPVSGEIIEINSEISDEPELVNDAPYESWLFCIKANKLDELDALMNADDYQQATEDS